MRGEFENLRRRHACVFGVAAVHDPPEASHGGGHDVAFAEARGRGAERGDRADAFDPEDAREWHGGTGVAASGEEFGTIHTGGADADEDFVFLGAGDGQRLHLEDFGAAGLGHDCCAHCFGNGCHGDGSQIMKSVARKGKMSWKKRK